MLTDDAYDAYRDAARGLPIVRGFGDAGPAWRTRNNGDAAHNRRRNQIERLPSWARAIEEYFWPWRGETER
jgi:hypothetical protein